jgi:UDP-glucose 4-epimerase
LDARVGEFFEERFDMRLVITGGAGFIGSAVARAALEDGRIARVVVIDNFATGLRSNLEGLDLEVIDGSVLDRDLLTQRLAQADSVIHLAARPSVPLSIADPLTTNEANVLGTLTLLEACRAVGVGNVVVASSSSVYGSNPTVPKREDAWLGPLSPYAVSKLATETYAIAYQSSYGLSTMAFRFFNVYGPRQRADGSYPAVIPAFISCLLRNEPPRINGDGRQTRDFTFVENVARVLVDAAARRLTESRPVNLAFGCRASVNEVLGILMELSGVHLLPAHVEQRIGDIRDSLAYSSRLHELFPDVHQVPLRDGLERTLAWYRGREAP